ncbi:pentatricopeptide repeat-containing protein At4g25270, chloroplastic-like [Olea europaea var. sylvestris]|uniref:pentatricopeptide repeat-containing protein At4g25270, chloroplastic-like n=1 Tax=Olea europaea var. sylvestris TaxID=158386 RepID=UPI000C1CF58A|nr:pentatricopeptide repeat-containing protein At4g25270, chloroplastic-like [Olea europaea var. sylvestris]
MPVRMKENIEALSTYARREGTNHGQKLPSDLELVCGRDCIQEMSDRTEQKLTPLESPRFANFFLLSPLTFERRNLDGISIYTKEYFNVFREENTTRKQNKKYNQNPKPEPQLPKSSPTPLLTTPNIQSHTKLEALEIVINKIEASVKNGVEINDPHIFASLLETCFHLKAIDHGNKIYKLIQERLLRKNVGISSKLLWLYSCNGDVKKAHKVFDQMPKRNDLAFPWDSLTRGYAEVGLYEDALALYFQMVEEGVEPDAYTFPRALKACGGVGMIQAGEEVHRHVIRSGCGNNKFVQNALLDMYAKCGDISKAQKVFDKIVDKDLVSWNSMIIGYMRHNLMVEALDLLRGMMQEGCEPDSITISTFLTSALPYKIVIQIYGLAFRREIEWNIETIVTSLSQM